MGQTVLNLRKVKGIEYPPHAFFADLNHEDDIYKRITVPIKDLQLVEEFTKNFSLERSERSGLSVVIPFPNPTFNVEKMIAVAIGNYFYPLITGQLVLRFNGTIINRNNVREMAKKYASKRFHQIDILFDFIEEIYQAEKHQLLKLNSSWADDRKLDASDFDPEVLEEIRNSFSKGELVGLYLPVTLKLKDGSESESGFSVYIKRPSELTRGLDLYVRGGLTVPAEAKFKERRALGAMIAEDESICAFLGDAENAAHTQWTTNTEKLRKNYRNSQPVVSVIKKSVLQLYDLLADVTEDKDEGALQDFFWFDEPEKSKVKRRKKPKKPKDIPPIEKAQPQLLLSQVSDGFTITNTKHMTPEHLPKEIRVKVAYEVAKGNAFKKYSPHDFKVGKNGNIKITANSAIKLLAAKDNVWVFEASELPLKITTKGFDANRDLKVKIG
jgi:hypothetical protein